MRFVVDAALQSPAAAVKEFEIGMAVYDRTPDYDPRTDPIVRVEAARLRARLREYYETSPPDAVRIDIPKGQYIPQFISARGEPAQLSILVPPFRSLSADARHRDFCDGLTEEVLHRLAQNPRLRVITQSVAAWLERGEGPKPRFLLEGSVRRIRAEMRLTLHLTELAGGGSTHFSNVYRATVSDVFATQERLADEIGRDISAALNATETG